MRRVLAPAPAYDNFALLIDLETLEMHRHVVGAIWLWTPELEFPYRGSNDFVVLMANEFLLEAYMLLGDRQRASVWLMSGPYRVDLEVVDVDTWSVEGIDRGNGSRTPTIAVRRRLFVAQVLDAGRALLKACQRHGWKPTSVVDLEVGVARLEREAAYRLGEGWNAEK